MVDHNRRSDDAAVREIAREAADAALDKLFLTLGVDISTPEGIIALQDDMRYVRTMREMSKRIGHNTADTMWKVLIGAGIIWLLHHFGVPDWIIQKFINFGN